MRHGTTFKTFGLYIPGNQLKYGPKNPVHSVTDTAFIFQPVVECRKRPSDYFSPTPCHFTEH